MANEYIISEDAFENLADGVRRVAAISGNLSVSEMVAALNNYTPSGIETCTVTLIEDGPLTEDVPVYYVNGSGSLSTAMFPTQKTLTVAKNSILVLTRWVSMSNPVQSGSATQVTSEFGFITVFITGDSNLIYRG